MFLPSMSVANKVCFTIVLISYDDLYLDRSL